MAREPMDTSKVAITGQFTLTAQLPDGRGVNIVGYLYDGESAESVDERIDLLQDAIERQRARCEIPVLEAQLRQFLESMEATRKVMAEFGREQELSKTKKLPQNKQQALDNMIRGLPDLEKRIKEGQEKIAASKARFGIK